MDSEQTIAILNNLKSNTLMEHLGIVYTHTTNNSLQATMPVSNAIKNPIGIVHGGALMALAESVASALSFLHINIQTKNVVGLEINGNHIRSVTSGILTATATFIHKGQQTHVTDITITDNNGRLINKSRMTHLVIDKI